jgi:hypothetical protein
MTVEALLGLILGGLIFAPAGLVAGWLTCRWMDRHHPIETEETR